MIKPEMFINRKETPPSAQVTAFAVNGKIQQPSWLESDSSLSHQIEWTKEILLNYDQNHLTFYLAAFDFSNPVENKIEYRMRGVNDSWQRTTDNQPFVNFHKLNPGSYRLDVRAATAHSYWSDEIASLKVTITPPFWMSTSAYLFYFFILLVVVVSLYKINKLRLQRLQKLVIREQQVAARLKEVDAMKDQFLANTSHELKTPLNAIIGLSDYLISEDLTDISSHELIEMVTVIKSSGTRMNELVEDILQCSRLTKGKLKINLVSVNLYELVAECILESRASRVKKDVSLHNNIPLDFSRAYADPGRVRQIILNLIGNAMKFTLKGKIQVSAKEINGEMIEVSVSDTGIGIEKQYQENIFEAFVQVDASTRREYEGSGLGLSIVKQLVELQGGQVSIDSSPNIGTIVSFTLKKSKVI